MGNQLVLRLPPQRRPGLCPPALVIETCLLDYLNLGLPANKGLDQGRCNDPVALPCEMHLQHLGERIYDIHWIENPFNAKLLAGSGRVLMPKKRIANCAKVIVRCREA